MATLQAVAAKAAEICLEKYQLSMAILGWGKERQNIIVGKEYGQDVIIKTINLI